MSGGSVVISGRGRVLQQVVGIFRCGAVVARVRMFSSEALAG